MVGRNPFLKLRWGPYTLTAIDSNKSPLLPPLAPTHLRVTGVNSGELTVQIRGVDTPINQDGSVELNRPLVTENSSIEVYIEGPLPSVLKTSPKSSTVDSVFSHGEFQHFTLRYRGAVGDIEWLWVTAAGQLKISLESFPTKMDYRDDFRQIRQDLDRLAPTLTASPSGAAGGGFDVSLERDQASALEWIELVRREYSGLASSIARLLPALRRQVDRSVQIVSSDRLRNLRPISRRQASQIGGNSIRPVLVRNCTDSEATALNGHLRWEVDRLRMATSNVANASWFGAFDADVKSLIAELQRSTAQWSSVLIHVPPVVELPGLQTKLRDPLYEIVFRHLRKVRSALVPLDDAVLVGLKDLPTLYEYWVFLRTIEILRKRFNKVVSFSEPLVQRVGAQLVMVQGRKSEVHLRDDNGREIRCQYNRTFTRLPTTNQRPDSVIWVKDSEHMLIIDAKYRIGADSEYQLQFGMPGPLAEDINVIHRYRDAIVFNKPPYRQFSHGGLIAFPGRESPRFRNHRFFRSWQSVRVGGIPMLPSGTQLMEEVLEQYLIQLPGGTS
ncbi:DUF2357 domain-containing protein [Rhodococcus qingshengii]|uniref:DUF2357 domain-containing protein n=1 Tax=Rhodococcus qingshengii TaxID=334542 RepID=UPI001BE7D994|nr:DUF2357 domain-containing protein [Rhodococcus qingshengii]MBT2273228.1 DUF2357 domain-containing protein [Rhodococcus qingshengii]